MAKASNIEYVFQKEMTKEEADKCREALSMRPSYKPPCEVIEIQIGNHLILPGIIDSEDENDPIILEAKGLLYENYNDIKASMIKGNPEATIYFSEMSYVIAPYYSDKDMLVGKALWYSATIEVKKNQKR